ncbi:MAG: head GIN domain-containing protein [Cyclobacteriaceae bacterium]
MNKLQIQTNALIILSMLICLCACAQNDLGEVIIKEEQNLPPFSKININSLGNVELKIDDSGSIRIETHEEIINNIKYEVKDDELIVSYKSFRRNQNIRTLNITVSSVNYEKITLNNVAEINVTDPVRTTNLEINQKDVGSIKLIEVTVDNLLLNQEDVGNIKIQSGSAINGVLRQEGVGNINTFGVTYENCKATLNDVGNIEVTVSALLEASIRGVGNILYKGDPEVSKSISGTGNVIKK